jgi:hypothetical protein
VDIGKAFSFVFEDPNWPGKIIIGGVIAIIPIIGWILVMGYMVAVARNVIRGAPQPLPEWSDFGQLFLDGLYGIVIAFVYALPIIVVSLVTVTPASILSGDDGGAAVTLASCCFAAFALIYGLLAGWLFVPAALGRYADTGDIMAGLRFGEVLEISRASPVDFLLALIVSWVVGFLAGFGVILCCVGALFTGFYAQCVTGHAYGQAYLEAKAKAP